MRLRTFVFILRKEESTIMRALVKITDVSARYGLGVLMAISS
jgi:hypothetical protein